MWFLLVKFSLLSLFAFAKNLKFSLLLCKEWKVQRFVHYSSLALGNQCWSWLTTLVTNARPVVQIPDGTNNILSYTYDYKPQFITWCSRQDQSCKNIHRWNIPWTRERCNALQIRCLVGLGVWRMTGNRETRSSIPGQGKHDYDPQFITVTNIGYLCWTMVNHRWFTWAREPTTIVLRRLLPAS